MRHSKWHIPEPTGQPEEEAEAHESPECKSGNSSLDSHRAFWMVLSSLRPCPFPSQLQTLPGPPARVPKTCCPLGTFSPCPALSPSSQDRSMRRGVSNQVSGCIWWPCSQRELGSNPAAHLGGGCLQNETMVMPLT